MEPEKGERGLWYVGTVGFATKEQAQAYIDRGMKHFDVPVIKNPGPLYGLKWPLFALTLFIVVVGSFSWWLMGGSRSDDPDREARRAALLSCQKTIAAAAKFGKKEYPPYPTVQTNNDYFIFSWKAGDFYFKNGFGVDVPQSAHCEVNRRTGRIEHLDISGKIMIKQ